MKRAAIDIGTNSTRLYIADVNGSIKRIEKRTVITRLGKGVDSRRRLGSEGIEKNIEVLLEYKNIAQSFGVENIIAIATSAVRDAENRDDFVKAVKERVGILVDVISGKEEAELGFLGASSVLQEGRGVVLDIGGGSTELIYGMDGNIEVAKSIDVGAVRITEKFLNPGKISSQEIEKADEYIRKAVSETTSILKNKGQFSLVGIGGTATTLAAIDLGLDLYDIEKVHGYRLSLERVENILGNLADMSLEERVNIPGLQKERADIIPAGTLILKIVMEELMTPLITVSECDNLDGVIIRNMQ